MWPYKYQIEGKSRTDHTQPYQCCIRNSIYVSLNQSSSCQVAHKVSTRERHCCRSAARLVMVSHVRPHSFVCFFTVRLHVSCGRPRLLLPPAVQRKAVLGSAPGDIRHTCPSHLYLRLLICVARDVLRNSSSLVIVLGQNTNRIFCRHMFWKVSRLCASLAVSFQHSDPQRSTVRTFLLYSLCFVFSLNLYFSWR